MSCRGLRLRIAVVFLAAATAAGVVSCGGVDVGAPETAASDVALGTSAIDQGLQDEAKPSERHSAGSADGVEDNAADSDASVTEPDAGASEPAAVADGFAVDDADADIDAGDVAMLDIQEPLSDETVPGAPGEGGGRAVPDVLAPFYALAPDGAWFSDLPGDAAQLVVISDIGGEVRAAFFEEVTGSGWVERHELGARAWGGSNGIRVKQREGDRVTPVGQFPVLEAFYIDNEPETGLETFRITQDTYWVDDPASTFYNRRVEGDADMDWNSAEHMISYYGSYKYGFVVGYNTDCIPGLGSAVFFTVASRDTLGCVGVSESACLAFLVALDIDKHPYILIVSDYS